jgi:hypothetical protein
MIRTEGFMAGHDEDQVAAGRSIEELRYRIDGFTPERRQRFLAALRQTGCIRDAARAAGVTSKTIDRLRRIFADFDAQCRAARDLAVPNLEAIAFQRATVGAPAKIVRKGKLFEVRVKPSDSMLRLLLAGAAPEKYGRFAGLAAAKGEADGAPGKWSFEAAAREIEKALAVYRLRRRREGGETEAGAPEEEGGGDGDGGADGA